MSVGDRDLDKDNQAQGKLLPLESTIQPRPRQSKVAQRGRPSEAAARSPEPAPQPTDFVDEKSVGALCQNLRCARASGKVPLFVLGAGASANRVPLLKDIADWFRVVEDLPVDNKPTVEKRAPSSGDPPDEQKLKVEKLEPRLNIFLDRLAGGTASRADAAELFSTLQLPSYRNYWEVFSKAFLLGPQPDHRIPALKLGKDGKAFDGLLKAEFSDAHSHIARLLQEREAHVFSLNFDGLTVSALTHNYGRGVALHTRQQVRAYFSATDGDFVPAVIKVRGDVFYARCFEPLCPASNEEHPLDRLTDRSGDRSVLRCPACGQRSVVLQFSFPGFRVKEEAAHPILWEARRFLAQRLSAVIIIGLSGRWDRYLLDFLFDLAVERELVIADVKPPGDDGAVIDSFRKTYYRSCKPVTQSEHLEAANGGRFIRIQLDADKFCERFNKYYARS